MKSLIVALLVLTMGCAIHPPKPGFMDGMTPAETKQVPQAGALPDDTGIFVAYQFTTRDLREEEAYKLLTLVIKRVHALNDDDSTEFWIDFSDTAIICAYSGPTLDVAATADYAASVVELWTSERGKDHYVKKTYAGDPDTVLQYLIAGTAGQPKIEEGKASDEVKSFLGKKGTL